MTDLSLVDTDELLAELLARFDHAVFAGLKSQIGASDRIEFTREWIGNTHTCLGLTADLQARIIENFREEETPE